MALSDGVGGATGSESRITVADDSAALVERTEPIDVLVNVAGVGYLGLVEDMTADDVGRMFDVNAVSTINLTLAVLPGMLQRRHGHVVNVGSIGGFFAGPPITVYSATKYALRAFSDGLRREVSGRGVRVTLIAPGTFRTEFFDSTTGQTPDLLTASVNRTALPVRFVADAVQRAIERPGLPAYQTISVHRVYGLSRLGELPGVSTLLDATSRVTMETLWRRGGRHRQR